MRNSTLSRPIRQSGVTLIDFMVGLTVGLLVALAAVSSLIIIRSSARTMTDSAALEQQASLVMMQIGQQISQAGAINAYAGNDPNAGIGQDAGSSIGNGNIQFDTRPIGVSPDNPGISVFGIDGGGTAPDTLYISYAAANDGSPAKNCAGNNAREVVTGGSNVLSVVSIFTIQPQQRPGNTADASDLMCGDGSNARQPIASNVVDMQIKYWLNGGLQDASAVPATQWGQVNGLEICLEVQGNPTQAPQQTFPAQAACWNTAAITRNDGRVHRFVKQTFYLRNTA